MRVSDLKKILQNLDDTAAVKLEYMPRAHEDITEDVQGVRVENGEVVLFGNETTEFLT